MKKFYLIGAGCLAVALSSCMKDSHFESTTPYPASAISLITSLDDNEVTPIAGTYVFQITVTNDEATAVVYSPGEGFIADNTSLVFSTTPASYKTTNYDIYVSNAKGTVGNTGMELNNANFLALNPKNENMEYGYYYDLSDIGDYTFRFQATNYITVARYNISDSFRVNTFPIASFFKGTTTTSYSFGGSEKQFVTEDITYRFNIYKEENSKDYKAYMILYNARFAEEMPMSLAAVLVEDLDIDFTPNGIVITGENIIPSWYSNNQYLPLERYIFKSVRFETTNQDYTQGKLTYQVGDDYLGEFTGSYAKTYYNP